jgi:hypothetical protein
MCPPDATHGQLAGPAEYRREDEELGVEESCEHERQLPAAGATSAAARHTTTPTFAPFRSASARRSAPLHAAPGSRQADAGVEGGGEAARRVSW